MFEYNLTNDWNTTGLQMVTMTLTRSQFVVPSNAEIISGKSVLTGKVKSEPTKSTEWSDTIILRRPVLTVDAHFKGIG